MEHVIAPEHIKQFMFSGRAHFTVVDSQYNTKQVLHCVQNKQMPEMYWVHQGATRSHFLGTIFKEHFKIKTPGDPDAHTFYRFFTLLMQGGVPDTITVYHHNECGKCRRPLTDPVSIMCGIGPECRKKLGIKL